MFWFLLNFLKQVLEPLEKEEPCIFLQLVSPPMDWWCDDRSAAWDHMKEKLCGTLEAKNSLMYGSPAIAEKLRYSRYYFFPQEPQGIMAIQPKFGYSGIYVPGMCTFYLIYSIISWFYVFCYM